MKLAIVLALVVPACLLLSHPDPPGPPFAEPTYQQLVPDRMATQPGEVVVLDAFKHDHLPEGVRFANDHLEVAEPHVTLGVVRMLHNHVESPSDETQSQMLARMGKVRDDAYARLVAAAARHGANAVYIEQKDGNYGAQAMYFSSEKPTYPPADALLAQAERPGGYAKQRQLVVSLDAPAPVDLHGQRGQCYALVLALDRDAHLADHTRDGIHVALDSVDRELANTMFATPLLGAKRASSVDLGCPDTSGRLAVRFVAGANREHRTELGTGHVVVQVYTKSISAAEVQAMIDRRAAAWAHLRRRQCNACYRDWVRCPDNDPRQCRAYMSCLAGIGETIESCEAR